jgi:hypothetical protein
LLKPGEFKMWSVCIPMGNLLSIVGDQTQAYLAQAKKN